MKQPFRPPLVLLACLAGTLASGSVGAQQYRTSFLFGGLDNPRGLTIGPDGALYVAEAGRGGPGASIPGPPNDPPQSYGATSAVTRYLNGNQQRVVTGLPSLAGPDGASASGLHDLSFAPNGDLYGVIGFVGDPALRDVLTNQGAPGSDFAQLVRLNTTNNSFQKVADLGQHEATQNPDAPELNSNPYSLLTGVGAGNGIAVIDAGANALLAVDSATGAVTTSHVFPARPNPLPFGPSFYQAVPTSIALGPDGDYYIGQLTGFPFPPGEANVFHFDPDTGQVVDTLGGFTNIVDVAFGPDGMLYVLEIDASSLVFPPDGNGALIRLDPTTGMRTTIVEQGLLFPTGITFDESGSIFVSNLGVAPFGGHVLFIQQVPEPDFVALLLGSGTVGMLFCRRGKRSK